MSFTTMPISAAARISRSVQRAALAGLAGLILFFAMPAGVAQHSAIPNSGESEASHSVAVAELPRSAAHQETPDSAGRERIKLDVAELSKLSNQLRDQLQEMNVNVYPLGVVKKTEAIEKLVRKIKADGNER